MTETDIPDLRGKRVTCSRCMRNFVNVPHDPFLDPAEWLGWDKGGVCQDCIIELAQEFIRKHGHKEADKHKIPMLIQYGTYRRKNGPDFVQPGELEEEAKRKKR